jgi:serine/threonine protein kinase/tetratricopeptide (TPR) repeat protein
MNFSETPHSLKSSLDKGKLKIHNLIPSIERTYLPVGTIIGKYKIIEEIDRGGMAVVYKALQMDLDRIVALKVLPANITINRRFVDRFLSEAHAVAKLSHPNIVNIHEVAVENNVYYLAMDYIPGINLYYYLNYQKPKLIEVLEITAKLADALAYAHKQKIVHRDLKLNNVIMKDNTTPVLIDFGLAKALESEEGTITKTGEIMGSPAYMAPERLLGKNADARSDICSLGIMLYEMLTFKNPYLDPRSIHQTTLNVIEANPIPPRKLVSWLPPEIEAITLKAMDKDPDKRYQTMEEFAEDIRRYQRGDPVLANPPSKITIIKHYVKKHWPPVVIIFIIMSFLGIFFYLSYIQSQKEKPFWQLMYQKNFSGLTIGDDWAQYPGVSQENEGWSDRNGELVSPSNKSFIRLERPFTRDVRVEFDIRPVEASFFDAGFFFYGSCPDSGYCFYLFKGPKALCGITYPGNSFLFYDYHPYQLSFAKQYHVIVERKENVISFKINDVLIARIYDFFPPVGINHQSLGFFTNRCKCAIDNLKIYRYSIPMISSTTLIADRLIERGAISTAIEEYEEMLMDYPPSSIKACEIELKIAECYIRLNKYDKALEKLSAPKIIRGDENIKIKSLYLKGIANSFMGRISSADSAYISLGSYSNAGFIFYSALLNMALEIEKEIKNQEYKKAEQKILFLIQNYPKNSNIFGNLHLSILESYIDMGEYDNALETGFNIIRFYSSDNNLIIQAKIMLSKIFMAKGQKEQALDILNQCLSSYMSFSAVWDAWMELASIYEYDQNYSDAYITYKKIYEDCPKSIVTSWMARIKMGEIAKIFSIGNENSDAIFTDVIRSSHNFILPRIVAQYYKGIIKEDEFKFFWNYIYLDNNKMYLYFFLKKAIMDNKKDLATKYFKQLKDDLVQNSLILMQTEKLYKIIKKIK